MKNNCPSRTFKTVKMFSFPALLILLNYNKLYLCYVNYSTATKYDLQQDTILHLGRLECFPISRYKTVVNPFSVFQWHGHIRVRTADSVILYRLYWWLVANQ